MSTSDDTDGLRPRYGCKFRLFSLFSAHLEVPGGRLPPLHSPEGEAGSGSPLRFCSCKRPRASEKFHLFVSQSDRVLFLTAWLLPNCDFRVFIIMYRRVGRVGGGGGGGAFRVYTTFSTSHTHVGLYGPSYYLHLVQCCHMCVKSRTEDTMRSCVLET